MSFSKGTEKPDLKLIDADCSQQEFFALADMQGNGTPAHGLVLEEILKGIAPFGRNIVNKGDVTRGVNDEWFRVTPTVVRLARMPTGRGFIPTEHLIVVICVAVANFGIVLGTLNITLNPKVLLPKLVDQPSKGPKQTLLHACSQRSKALRVGLILIIYGGQTLIPLV